MKTIINREAKFLIKDTAKDFHSDYGMVKKEDFGASKVATNKGVAFSVFDSSFMDIYDKIRRTAQIITLKDIGTIIAYTGVNKDSLVVEAGSGSGALGCMIAHLCKMVVSYDIREDHQSTAISNAKLLGIDNITFKLKDARQGFDEGDADLIVLDMPDPWNAFASAASALKRGGFLVLYSPTIPQVMESVAAIEEKHGEDLLFISAIETIQREWDVDGRKVRPKSTCLNHTGFLTFFRRI